MEASEYMVVPNFPSYRTSKSGMVQRCVNHGRTTPRPCWKRFKPHLSGRGYQYVRLYNNGKYKKFHIGSLVLFCFVGPPNNRQCCHKNGRPGDNRHGRTSRGSARPAAKLLEKDIPRIFGLRALGLTMRTIAKKFGVSRPLIGYVLSRKIWRHVDVA